MVKKVYKTLSIVKTHTVKKKIVNKVPKYRIEKITVNSKKGYCGRCGLYFNYGDNKRRPYSCPNCVCIDCGDSIDFRYREFNGQKIIRCYPCYSIWKYGKHSYKTGYETSYNHIPPVKGKEESKRVEYTEELIEYKDEIESYTDTKKVIEYPKKIKYNEHNGMFVNDLSLSTLLNSKIYNIDNEVLKSDINWYGCDDINIDFNSYYSKPIKDKSEYQMWGMLPINFNEMIISEKQTLEEFCDVVGFYPNVPAFIQGHPLSMYNNKRKNVVELEKSVTLFINLAVESVVDYSQYKTRGKFVYHLIEEILKTPSSLNEHIKVNLMLLDATYTKCETLIQKLYISYDELIKNKNIIYNILTDVSFFRLLLLDKKIDFIRENKLSEEWYKGQGNVLNKEHIRKILDLYDTDIIVGSVDEIGITGIYSDDDHINFLDSIGLLEENIIDSLNTEIEEVAIKDVLNKRNISKLIHVTNKNNLESILEHGLLSIKELEKLKIEYEFNDPLRLENKKDAICLSVTDFNNFLFHSFQKKYPQNEYVVLEIDPKILLIEGIEKRFYDYNAASKFSQYSNTNMEIMFKNKMKRRAKIKTRLGKKDNEPTSYQAEILYCGKIEPKHIINYYDLGKLN